MFFLPSFVVSFCGCQPLVNQVDAFFGVAMPDFDFFWKACSM